MMPGFRERFGRRTLLIGAALAAVLGGTAAALAATDTFNTAGGASTTQQTETTPAEPPQPGPPQPTPVTTVDPTVASAYQAFRRAPTAGDTAPFADRPLPDGAAASLARRGTSSPTGHPYYLVPSKEGLCILAENGGGGCTSASQAVQGDLIVSVCERGLAAGSVRLAGMFPDGVQEITLSLADGSQASVPVSSNTLVTDVPVTVPGQVPVKATWTTKDGIQGQPVPIPPDAASVNCAR